MMYRVLCVLLLCVWRGATLRRLDHYGLLRPPARPPHLLHVAPPPERWFTQKLDHFQPTDRNTWQQRYFVNDTFHRRGGPVFLMIGGEGTANPLWMLTGQWIEYARQHNALCFLLEHRFYGKSHPTPDMSVKSLRYLSSSQALADLASFSAAMTQQYQLSGSRWLAFGGSYPGSLAAWYRLKYPHLVHAAVATSAPLQAKTNFLEFLEVVSDAVRLASGAQCYDLIKESFSALHKLVSKQKGWSTVSDMFRLCSPLDGHNANDVSNLISLLADYFESTVQYNEDNRDFEGARDTNITIHSLCRMMTKERDDDGVDAAVNRLSDINLLFLSLQKQRCLDHTYNSVVKQLQNEQFNSIDNNGGRQWIYQTCTEFGWYQTSDYKRQPFGHDFPLAFSVQLCLDAFGDKFNGSFIESSVGATNVDYGGRDIAVSRVVFVNGNIDPWHAMGLTETRNHHSPVIYINGTAHCANMYPARASDLPDLVSARRRVGQLIADWLELQ